MVVSLDTVEFRSDLLARHMIEAIQIITEERKLFDRGAELGTFFALLSDDGLTVIAPVFCHGEPHAVIILGKFPDGWRFRGAAQA